MTICKGELDLEWFSFYSFNIPYHDFCFFFLCLGRPLEEFRLTALSDWRIPSCYGIYLILSTVCLWAKTKIHFDGVFHYGTQPVTIGVM